MSNPKVAKATAGRHFAAASHARRDKRNERGHRDRCLCNECLDDLGITARKVETHLPVNGNFARTLATRRKPVANAMRVGVPEILDVTQEPDEQN